MSTTAAEAAAHWEALAKAERDMAAWYESRGLPYGSVNSYYRAQNYEAIAKSLRLEAETGKPHCSICFGDHPNHLHMHRG